MEVEAAAFKPCSCTHVRGMCCVSGQVHNDLCDYMYIHGHDIEITLIYTI